MASVRVQGHAGTITECASCHRNVGDLDPTGGPHGMHPLGAVWVDHHADASEHGGLAECRACHGADDRGTVLSRSHADRTLSTEFGTKHFWRAASGELVADFARRGRARSCRAAPSRSTLPP